MLSFVVSYERIKCMHSCLMLVRICSDIHFLRPNARVIPRLGTGKDDETRRIAVQYFF